jgi:hypothetical protein
MATAPNEISCLLCLDNNEETLLENTRCSCKYHYHASCFQQYMKHNNCPLCQLSYTEPTPEPEPRCCSNMTFGRILLSVIVISLAGVITASYVK